MKKLTLPFFSFDKKTNRLKQWFCFPKMEHFKAWSLSSRYKTNCKTIINYFQERTTTINSSTQIMNVNGATYTTKHQNQLLHGLTDHQVSVMITTLVRSKTPVKVGTVLVRNTVVKHRIRSPVVYRVLYAMVMEHAGI